METFRQELREDLKAARTIEHPELLTPDDREMWEKIKQGTVTPAGFDAYRAKVNQELREQEAGKSPEAAETRKAREAFVELAADRATMIFNKWLADHPERYK